MYYISYFCLSLRWLSSQKEEGERTHSGQLQQISQLKQELREEMTNRIKLESNLAEDKVIKYLQIQMKLFNQRE